MTPETVDRLLREYDEWHEGYLKCKDEPGLAAKVEKAWQDHRNKIRNHLIRSAPTLKEAYEYEKAKAPPVSSTKTENRVIIVNEEADTRKQEL